MVTERILDSGIKEYTLDNGDIKAVILNFGGRIQRILVKDKNGIEQDVVLGYDDAEDYFNDGASYGALVGRYANRIIGARFELEGKEYILEKNNGENHLHGTFAKRLLDSRITGENSVTMTLTSTPEEEGYPGTLYLSVSYTLTRDSGIVIDYTATTDEDTVVNITNHSYFNLGGQKSAGVEDHILTMTANRYTTLNDNRLVTGEIKSVDGGAFDFRNPIRISDALKIKDPQIELFSAFDHNMILPEEDGFRYCATLFCPDTGIEMQMFTTEPAVQLYMKNAGKAEYTGGKNRKHTALCLEAQHYPSSVNFPDFPSTVLKSTSIYRQTTEYRFTTVK